MWTLISAETSCEDDEFGVGKEEDIVTVACDEGNVGQQQYKCTNSKWVPLQDNCVLEVIKNLEDQSQVMFCWTIEDFPDSSIILSPVPPGSCKGLLWYCCDFKFEFQFIPGITKNCDPTRILRGFVVIVVAISDFVAGILINCL